MSRARAIPPAAFDTARLPPIIRRRIAQLRLRSRGPRSAGEWAAFRQRMAETNANLTIEDLPLTSEELAFFDFVFGLNLVETEEDSLHMLFAEACAHKAVDEIKAAE